MNEQKLKIGLFGFGCVGQGLFHLIQESASDWLSIEKICVKNKDRTRSIDAKYFTYDKNDILENPDIDLIVELTSDPTDALEIIKHALHARKPVITAGKKVVSENFEQLLKWQKETGTPLLYEAAVGGSIPIIRTLEDYYAQDSLHEIGGILNGTTNYILSRTLQHNLTYGQALREAQELGFAEANPDMDVLGTDPKLKLIILIAHAFGTILNPEEIFHYGITQLSNDDTRYVREKNCTLKLLAHVSHSEDSLHAYVLPHLIPESSQLHGIHEEFNAVSIHGKYAHAQFLSGKGAGSHPTATAVLSDLAACKRKYKYLYKKIKKGSVPLLNNDKELNVYLRYSNDNTPAELGIDELTESYYSDQLKYVVGKVKLRKLMQHNIHLREDIFLAAVN